MIKWSYKIILIYNIFLLFICDFLHTVFVHMYDSIEYEIVEKIAKDVSEKPDHVYVGDLNSQIAMYEQLKKIQVKIFWL